MPKGDGHIDTAAREREEGTSDARQRLSSRRGFLSGSAKLLGGGALALGLGAAPALAKTNNDDKGEKQQGGKGHRAGHEGHFVSYVHRAPYGPSLLGAAEDNIALSLTRKGDARRHLC
jgi:hypothetical protein